MLRETNKTAASFARSFVTATARKESRLVVDARSGALPRVVVGLHPHRLGFDRTFIRRFPPLSETIESNGVYELKVLSPLFLGGATESLELSQK